MDVDNLSDNELRQQLIALGQSVGPVTPSTRAVYIKKLKNLLQKQGDASVNLPRTPPRSELKTYVKGAPTSNRKRRHVSRVTKANQDQGLCNTNTIPQIPLSRIDDLDGTLLGEGAFGRVVKCRFRRTPESPWEDVAIKYARSAYRSALVREAKIFYTYLNHKNCIEFFGLYSCPLNGTGIVMELMDCSLAWLISKQSIKYEVDHAISWLYQLSDAMSFFHSKEQVHRDLKLQNLLLCNDYHTLKVCDFGTYTTLHESMTMEKGTPITMAPEVIRASKDYNEKCDIYSFGIIMWQVIARRPSPYQESLSPYQDRCYVVFNVARNRLRPPELSCDPLLSRFYKACWDHDPDMRPSSEQVKQYFAVLRKAFPNGNRDLVNTSSNGPTLIPHPKLATPYVPQHRRTRSDPMIPYNRRSPPLSADLDRTGDMEDVCLDTEENTDMGDIEQIQNENEHGPPLGFLRPFLRYLEYTIATRLINCRGLHQHLRSARPPRQYSDSFANMPNHFSTTNVGKAEPQSIGNDWRAYSRKNCRQARRMRESGDAAAPDSAIDKPCIIDMFCMLKPVNTIAIAG